ncbi:hypothetical protein AB0I98_06790 [Streptomyces sp. NPDC050211]|uniref:hypothetical protein n=1 Tax=Streptomyces sp. NPDC050211 TaxID=3154932 RepID=UPI00343F71A0
MTISTLHQAGGGTDTVSLSGSAHRAWATKFPPRPVPLEWPATPASVDEVISDLEPMVAAEKCEIRTNLCAE